MRTSTERTPLGLEVRVTMAIQNVSIAELARDSGISPSKLRARIDGGKDFGVEELAAVCKALGMSLSDLIRKSREAA
jgi:DNA-binding Xre family transcriptional regulator